MGLKRQIRIRFQPKKGKMYSGGSDLQIRGRGGGVPVMGARSQINFFSAFRSSVWHKKSRGGGLPWIRHWCIPVFRPKQGKNPTLWGGTYLYSLYKGVTSPPPGITCLVPCWGSKRGARVPTLILRPKWGPKSREKCFWRLFFFFFKKKKDIG